MNTKSIVGITAEYHPFHNGHHYQLNEAKRRSGADFAIVMLSGHFVQRGMPAAWDTQIRTEAALRCGADAVFEIPAPFSTASAREYASFSAAAMANLGADILSCGAEHADAETIGLLAAFLEEEPQEYREALSMHLRKGDSFPAARLAAVEAVLDLADASSHPEGTSASGGADDAGIAKLSSRLPLVRELLSCPNDLLALEYAMAIRRQDLSLKFLPVPRTGNIHDASGIKGSYASATAIREHLLSGGSREELAAVMPPQSLDLLPAPLDPDAFAGLYYRVIRQRIREGTDLTRYSDVSADLAGLIRGKLCQTASFRDLPETVKCRGYTHTRISRALTHIVLGITKDDMAAYKAAGYAPFVRLMGFRRDSAPVLSELKARSSVPILSKTADAPALLGTGTPAVKLLSAEAWASELWDSVYFERTGIRLPEFPGKQIVIV